MEADHVEKFNQVNDISSYGTVEVHDSGLVQCETPNKGVQKLKTPYVGMEFDSLEEGKSYYEKYGRQEGFWIRTRTSAKTRRGSDEITSRNFVCSHAGQLVSKTEKERSRSCSTIKCGCKASMRITIDRWTTKWKVTVFSDEHNHKVVTPIRRMKMRSNRSMPKSVMDLTEAFHRENLQVGKVVSILDGSRVGFDNRDCYNHLRNVRHKQLEMGDAQSVLNYFRTKQAENPQFFYAIQCDEDGRATNFFWVDARSRMSYNYFGDVVTFDTTYRTNKYDMPFAPFTGVNHHSQSIQFGCALLQDESEVTFVWLFETWLKAMGGRQPIAIITDQDLAMKGAIARVFPNSRHRLCIWHIKKKFAEKLSQVYFKRSKFKSEIKNCIWSTYKKVDFEEKWMKLIMNYGLEGNEWLRHLYDIRDSWVPIFNRGTFMAGMNTTGRSEGANAFFDGFVTSTTNLKEFVTKYEQALVKIVKRESDEDFVSEHKYRIVGEDDYLLKHAAKVYTRNLYEKFKGEWVKVIKFKVEKIGCDDGYSIYTVTRKDSEPEEFQVKFNVETHQGTCECQLFEFVGILCRHILKVFSRLDIDTIPPHFILARWRQEANKFRVMDSVVTNDDAEQSEALRLSHLCQQATKLACVAAASQKRYNMYLGALNDLSKKFAEDDEITICTEPPVNVVQEEDNQSLKRASELLLLDPNVSQTKGRKKDEKGKDKINTSNRLKSGIEIAQQKKKRKCALCHMLGHDKRICPSNPNKKKIRSDSQLDESVQDLDRDTESDRGDRDEEGGEELDVAKI